MAKKFSTVALVVALTSILGVRSGLAQTVTLPDASMRDAEQLLQLTASDDQRSQRSEKLKSGLAKLISDAKAGGIQPSQSQGQTANRNNLSKGAKIAIGVAIAVVVVLALSHAVSVGKAHPGIFGP